MSCDPDSCTTPSSDEPQSARLEVRKPDIAPDAAADNPPSQAADGLSAEAAALLKSLMAEVSARSADNAGHQDVNPESRKMDPIDLATYIVASRYRSFNVVLILLAIAVCVAALAFGSHVNPISTISLTSAGTAAIVFGKSAAKKRQERRQDSASGADTTKHENGNSGQ